MVLQGMIAVVDPASSWSAKWLHLRTKVPGCYALAVNSEPPPHIEEIMESNGVKLRRPG
jgi:transcription elongation factor SPT4